MNYKKLFWMCVLFVSPIVMAKNKIVYYEPKVVELTGIIKHLTFPGSPNYESIKKGDSNETCPYLILEKPINVHPMRPVEALGNQAEIEKNVSILEMSVVNDRDFENAREGAHVRVVGTLFHAEWGRNYTRVLILVNKVNVLPMKKVTAEEIAITKEDYVNMKEEEDEDQKFPLKIKQK